MDLATTLAFILLIGAVVLAVVSVLAYRLYRNDLRPAPPPAASKPSLDVPAPALPEPAPTSADGAATAPPEPACSAPPADKPDDAETDLSRSGLAFLEYDGEAFVPVQPGSLAPADRPAQETLPTVHRTNGFAWR